MIKMKSNTEISKIIDKDGKTIVIRSEKLNVKGVELFIKTPPPYSISQVYISEKNEYIGSFQNPVDLKPNKRYFIFDKQDNLLGCRCTDYVCVNTEKQKDDVSCNPSKHLNSLELLIDNYNKNKK